MKKPIIEATKFTDQHYAALGKVVVEFESLQSTITYGLLKLIEPEKQFFYSKILMAIINEHSFANRLKLLLLFPSLSDVSEILIKKNNFKLEEYEEAIKQLQEGSVLANEAESKRNQLIHSTWIHGGPLSGPKGTVLRSKSRVKKSKMHTSVEFISANDIEEIAQNMITANDKIKNATEKLRLIIKFSYVDKE